MSLTIKIKRGTRSELNAAANNNDLIQAEPYLITDEDRIAIGLSPNSYQAFEKEGLYKGVLLSPPLNPVNGTLYINSNNNVVYLYYFNNWQPIKTMEGNFAVLLENQKYILQENGFKILL